MDVASAVNRAWHSPCTISEIRDIINIMNRILLKTSVLRRMQGFPLHLQRDMPGFPLHVSCIVKECTPITTLAMPRPRSVRILFLIVTSVTCQNFKGMFKVTPLFQGGEKGYALGWGKDARGSRYVKCLEPKWHRDHNDLWSL